MKFRSAHMHTVHCDYVFKSHYVNFIFEANDPFSWLQIVNHTISFAIFFFACAHCCFFCHWWCCLMLYVLLNLFKHVVANLIIFLFVWLEARQVHFNFSLYGPKNRNYHVILSGKKCQFYSLKHSIVGKYIGETHFITSDISS